MHKPNDNYIMSLNFGKIQNKLNDSLEFFKNRANFLFMF